MADQSIRFDDGDAYEHGMAPWSKLAGQAFLDWLAPATGLRWLDVGCGTGAFTELIGERCAPLEIQGIDPNEAQLAVARVRRGAGGETFVHGDAMALPFEHHHFDAAIMALVIFFVPDPAQALAEMVRVVRPGGLVAAYAWDLLGGGFPFDPVWVETRAAGFAPLLPQNPCAGGQEALRDLWVLAGLQAVQTRQILVERTFPTFDEYWATSTITGGVRPPLDRMTIQEREKIKTRVRARLPSDPMGHVRWLARANAIRGFVPTYPKTHVIAQSTSRSALA